MDLEDYALTKNCIDYDEALEELSEEEIITFIDKVYQCLFGGGYFNKENTKYIIRRDYISVYVNGKFDGNYYMIYDRDVKANRLYSYEDEEDEE